MTIFPPFVMRFSTSINAIKHSDKEVTDIVSLIEKYMVINHTKSVAVEGNQISFKYNGFEGVKSAQLVNVEKGVVDVTFNDNKVILIYTISMLKSILFGFLLLLILDFLFFFKEKRFSVGVIYIGLIVIGIAWVFKIIRERLVLNVIRRKVVKYLGTQVRLS